MYSIVRIVMVCGVLSVSGAKASWVGDLLDDLEEERACARCVVAVYYGVSDCLGALKII